MTDAQRSLFAFGLGYSALRLADRLLEAGWQVGGTVRGTGKADRLNHRGIAAIPWAGDPDAAPRPAEGTHWLVSVPPDAAGCPAFRAVADQAPAAASVTYLSTSGVYGDLGGGWAFEDTPVNPGSARARARVLAEDQWRSVRPDLAIVRLPGIYGPGRSAFDRLRQGTAQRIIKPEQVFSRVHVDDIAGGLVALLGRGVPGGVCHFCDNTPAPPQDVIAHAAGLLGLPVPPDEPFETAELSPMARSFYAECKRLSNAGTRARLDWQPVYPSYREGLAAILAGAPVGGD